MPLIVAAVLVVAIAVVLVVTTPWSDDKKSGQPQAGDRQAGQSQPSGSASTGPFNGTIEVVLTANVTSAQTDAIREDLRRSVGVMSVVYVSPAMASSLPPALRPDPLSPCFLVRVKDAQGAAAVHRIVGDRPGVSGVKE